MSDYYGDATLESWLYEEIFYPHKPPAEVVELFETWRESIEQDIESWIWSDDGDGNTLSWRGWGRGFNSVPDEDWELCQESIAVGGAYTKLFKETECSPIMNKEQYEQAVKLVDSMMDNPCRYQKLIDVLADKIETYEDVDPSFADFNDKLSKDFNDE